VRCSLCIVCCTLHVVRCSATYNDVPQHTSYNDVAHRCSLCVVIRCCALHVCVHARCMALISTRHRSPAAPRALIQVGRVSIIKRPHSSRVHRATMRARIQGIWHALNQANSCALIQDLQFSTRRAAPSIKQSGLRLMLPATLAPSFKPFRSHPINAHIQVTQVSGRLPDLWSALIQADLSAQKPPSITSGNSLIF
jgi:hypothetical protein